APPGMMVRSRCFRISTGASRETREISPKTNSSATISPSTVTVALGKASTIFASRSVSFKCLVIVTSSPLVAPAFHQRPTNLPLTLPILSCPAATLGKGMQDGIHSVSGVFQFHLHRDDRNRLQRGKISAQIHRIFFGGDESARFTFLFQLQQFAHVFFRI